jgi:hypothetical protein
MIIFLYNIFKAFVLFIKFLNFIYYYKFFIIINNNKLYYLLWLYSYIIKINHILLLLSNFKNKIIKIFHLFKILKLNFLYNLKKYAFNIKINNFFDKFYMLKLYNKTKEYSNSLIYNKIIYKQFYITKIFRDINNNTLEKFLNLFIKKEKKSLYNRFFFSFFINNLFIKKEKKIKRKLLFKNLFSLFFYNLFIYFFIIYLFIFWLNNLLNVTFYINDLFLLKLLKYNKNLSFYKINFTYNYGYNNKKKEYNKNYYLKILKLNKYYLMYNKLNLLKFYNIF